MEEEDTIELLLNDDADEKRYWRVMRGVEEGMCFVVWNNDTILMKL